LEKVDHLGKKTEQVPGRIGIKWWISYWYLFCK